MKKPGCLAGLLFSCFLCKEFRVSSGTLKDYFSRVFILPNKQPV